MEANKASKLSLETEGQNKQADNERIAKRTSNNKQILEDFVIFTSKLGPFLLF
jgi:hypothetical protein